MPIRTYEVPDISCDHCKRTIESTVRQLEGVSRVEVDVAKRQVRVEGDAPDPAIRQAIEDAEYTVAASSQLT